MTNQNSWAIILCYIIVTLSPIPFIWRISRNLLSSETAKNPEIKIMGSITLYMILVMVYTVVIACLTQ